MDYEKLSEGSLDEIMSNIREELRAYDESKTPADWDAIDKLLLQLVIGKRIGLVKAPMGSKRGIKRLISRAIEKIYLRVAELSNRDIREFNGLLLSLLYGYRERIAQNESLISSLSERVSELEAASEVSK